MPITSKSRLPLRFQEHIQLQQIQQCPELSQLQQIWFQHDIKCLFIIDTLDTGFFLSLLFNMFIYFVRTSALHSSDEVNCRPMEQPGNKDKDLCSEEINNVLPCLSLPGEAIVQLEKTEMLTFWRDLRDQSFFFFKRKYLLGYDFGTDQWQE